MHGLGNWFFTIIRFANSRVSDVLSGYRILSKRFVKSLPIMSRGFEIEIEMTAVACACNFALGTDQLSIEQDRAAQLVSCTLLEMALEF